MANTQADQVAAYLLEAGKSCHNVSIADALALPRPTVRRILGQGTIAGRFTRTAPGTYEIGRVCMLEGCEAAAPNAAGDCPDCGRNRCPAHAATGEVCDCKL